MNIKVILDKLIKNGKQGRVGKISVKVDAPVNIGDKILQIESVKGSTIIKSKAKGLIKSIVVSEGSTVKIGDTLVEIEKTE